MLYGGKLFQKTVIIQQAANESRLDPTAYDGCYHAYKQCAKFRFIGLLQKGGHCEKVAHTGCGNPPDFQTFIVKNTKDTGKFRRLPHQ